MSKPYTSSHAYAWQDWASKLLFILLFAASLVMVAVGRFENTSLQRAQEAATGLWAPIGHFIASPVQTTTAGLDQLRDTLHNARNAGTLAQENEILRQWKQRAEQLQAENESLRKLLKVVPATQTTDLTARVLGSIAGPYSHQLQLAAGSEEGVVPSMAVVDSDGLVGRTLSATPRTAEVLLLTDINSRVAVVTGKSHEHAVAKGQGDTLLALDYLPQDTKIEVGEKIYTSGDGALLPAGILVGTVSEITGGQAKVIPAVDTSRLDFVRLLLAKD